MNWLTSISLTGKRVLLRADFNVPLNKKGEIGDDFRIVQTLPTMRHILAKGGKLVIISHLGDPEGRVVERLSTKKIQKRISELLGVAVSWAQDCVGKDIEDKTLRMRKGEALLLENLRFHKEEEANDQAFARALARLGDIYVSDAFGVAHRKHASVFSVPKFLPSVGGFLLQKEIEGLQKLLENPMRPMIAVVGGKKIESKLPTIDRLTELADEVLLGNLLAREAALLKIVFKNKEKVVVPLDGTPKGKDYDIGPETIRLFAEKIKKARTVFWSGPLGKYEEAKYAKGSLSVAQAIVADTSYAVAGGGNLLDFLGRYAKRDKFDHISTGGSSMLAFLARQELPGLKSLHYYGYFES